MGEEMRQSDATMDQASPAGLPVDGSANLAFLFP
jgi:hypothetical protein